MISPEQCRAARAWLGWPQPELARRAQVGLSTVRDFETGTRTPIQNNRQAIQGALEAAGIQFVFDGDQAVGITSLPSISQSPGQQTVPPVPGGMLA
jgi:predicted transcriptional regulator